MTDIKEEFSSISGQEHGTQHYKNRAKKLKRNRNCTRFLQNAKSFGKKSFFGHGAELEQAEYSYLVTMLEAMSKQKDIEERGLMSNNVLGQLKGKEIRTASNQVGSRVMENLLTYTDEETFAQQMDTFAENFRVVCCDKFASHVLQRMLCIAMLRRVAPLQPDPESEDVLQVKKQKPGQPGKPGRTNDQSMWPCYEHNLKEQYEADHRQKCGEFVERMAKYLINNLEEFAWDATANYVIRQCVLNLSGITEMKNGGDFDDTKHLIVPEKWQKLLQEFCMQLLTWPQFADLAGMELTSVMLQDLLRALAACNDEFMLEQLTTKLLKETFKKTNEKGIKSEEKYDPENEVAPEEDQAHLPKAFTEECVLRVLEVCIVVSSASFLKDKIFAKLFRGHLKQLAQSRMCNFAVQKLIDRTNDKDMMDMIFGELEKSLEDMLRIGHTGVVLALAKACARLSCQQGKFVKQLLDALHCSEATPAKMIMAVLFLIPIDVTPPNAPKIHLHGSLILQAILDFNKPIKFVTALLEMPSDRLVEILCDPRGSFIANAFVKSRFVGEKSREKLVRHLEGQYSQLALGVQGSRVVELMYEAGNPAQRENIVAELAEQCEQLNSKPWGVIINKRLLVDTYKRDPARWKVAIKRDAKVEKMFDKLVPGTKRKAGS
uniref:PUM-HD domain-containing protein n=1 Tax=Anopheles farauti TaxID=69004 RepID=A0A182QVR7_9DIPT